jgi:hypothetical protein
MAPKKLPEFEAVIKELAALSFDDKAELMASNFPGRIADMIKEARQIQENKAGTSAEGEAAGAAPKKPKAERKAPAESAKDYTEGDEMVGLDGNMYTIAVAKNGVQRWVKVKKA